MISHDRSFLNELATHTVEIRQRKLDPLPRQLRRLPGAARGGRGAIAGGLQKPAARDRAHDGVRQRFRAKNTKAAQAQSKLKQIERMEKIEAPVADEKKITSNFPSRNAAA
jgi:ATP-binding cassette, subfamily F, member 3